MLADRTAARIMFTGTEVKEVLCVCVCVCVCVRACVCVCVCVLCTICSEMGGVEAGGTCHTVHVDLCLWLDCQ